MQTTTDGLDPTKGFVLEYQEGSLERHYQAIYDATGHEIALEHIISVFQSYANGDDSWKGKYEWVKVNL